jgi:hypothetical protein
MIIQVKSYLGGKTLKKTIKVVAAIIENDKDEILCALQSPQIKIVPGTIHGHFR